MNMNHIEFRLQFIKNTQTGLYTPTVALYDLETNKVIGAKCFEESVDAEIYTKRAQKKLTTEDNGIGNIVDGFGTEKWFSNTQDNSENHITQKETLTELASVIENLLESVSVYLRKD